MILKIVLFFAFSISSFAAKANPLFHLKVSNQVMVQVILESFETTLIQDLKNSKKLAACMKIADAKTSAKNLVEIYMLDKNLFKEEGNVGYLEMTLKLAYVNCEALDSMRADKQFILNISRHLNEARKELSKL